MLQYTARRLVVLIPTLFAISIIAFVIIQLPPGDYLTSYISQLAANGEQVDQSTIQGLQEQYGLNKPIYVQYAKWMGGLLRGDFGYSFDWRRPVSMLLWNRLALTAIIGVSTLLLTWLIAFPIGILSAVRQYSIGDYVATFVAFIGVAIPEFLTALVLMWVAFAYFNQSVGGLFSGNFVDAPWSWDRVLDLLSHLWIPVIIIGVNHTAGLIRTMRANLLDELHKPYVVTARAKGLPEWKVILKYPVRVALNPFVSTAGWTLAGILSGSAIVEQVLNLPTTGPLNLRAVLSQDMFLAGSIILMLAVLTVVGTLISDLLLAWLDPRIRLQ
ncbi:MAG TPA: ABC transporter permease [Chloroflexota bacterium]|nr:ABC transporter permease [Chloroflexota bacterium]